MKRIIFLSFFTITFVQVFSQPLQREETKHKLKVSTSKITKDSLTTFIIKIRNFSNEKMLIPYFLREPAVAPTINTGKQIFYEYIPFAGEPCHAQYKYDTIDMKKQYNIMGFNGDIMDRIFFLELNKDDIGEISITYSKIVKYLPQYFIFYPVKENISNRLKNIEILNIRILDTYLSNSKKIVRLPKRAQ